MTRKAALILFASVVCAAGVPLVVTAQPGSNTDSTERRSPLPNNFGKLAVDDIQRTKLYQIQDEYSGKIEALQKQVKALIAERDSKMEELLTEGQKLRLKELRDEARQKAASRKDQPSDDNDSAEAVPTPASNSI